MSSVMVPEVARTSPILIADVGEIPFASGNDHATGAYVRERHRIATEYDARPQ